MNPRRRADDPHDNVDADYVEEWFHSLPKMAGQVERNRVESVQGRRRLLVLYTIIVIGLLLLAYRTELNGDRIDRQTKSNQQHLYEQCKIVEDNARRLNHFLDEIITATQDSRVLTPAEKISRIRQYESIKAVLPLCVNNGS